MIEEIDRVLQFLENIFVALALAGDVRNRPQRRRRAGRPVDRTDADAVPAEFALAEQGRGEAQLLGAALALARRLSQPVERLGDFRRPGEQAVDRAQAGGVGRARQRHIGLVGVDDPGIAFRHQQAVRARIGDELGDVVARLRPGNLQEADRIGQQRGNADEGQEGQQREDEPRRLVALEEGKGRHDHDQRRGEQQHQARAARTLGAVDAGMRTDLVHGNLVQQPGQGAFTFRDSRPFAKGLNSPDGALPESLPSPAFMPEQF